MHEGNSKLVLDKIRDYLSMNKIDFENHELIRNIKDRRNSRQFTFEDNIKGLIYAQLSNQTKWMNIVPKLSQIDKLFFSFDKAKITQTQASYFYEGIFALKCGNIATKKQMLALHDNILMLEQIEIEYGTLDHFYSTYPADEIAKLLSGGKYKLKFIGYALAWEFLRNVGIDGAKPDLHMRRIFGRDRLCYSSVAIASEDDVIRIADEISAETGYYKSYIDNLLWSYCADGYGEICTAYPKCSVCVVKEYCNHIN